MNNSEYKSQLFEMIISGKGLSYVMDACAELLHNPFVFANRSLQMVSKSALCDQYPELFGWFDDENGENLRIAHEANRAGYFQAIYASDMPVRGVISGISANWIAARVRLKDQVLGNILVPDCQTPFTEEYQQLLPLVCQTIAFALKQSDRTDPAALNYDSLLITLLSGKKNDKQEDPAIRDKFKLLGHKLPEKMRLLIVRRTGSDNTMSHIILDAQLRSQFPLSLGTVYKNDCIRILDARLPDENIEVCMREYLDTTQIACGISRCFSSPTSLRDAYLQADAAVRLCRNSKKKLLLPFDVVAGLYLLEQATIAHNMSTEGFVMPEVHMLMNSKLGGGIERIQDLAAYLSSGRNVTRAAEIRNIHKNSMYYRLNRIMELTGLNLNNDEVCVQLVISLSLIGFLPYNNSYSDG